MTTGAGSLTTDEWCELREKEQQYETGVSYPTEVIVNQQINPEFIYNLLVNQLLAIPILGHRGILNKIAIF